MKIDIMDINKFIEVNNIKEVFNPIFFNKGNYPTSDGLFSYELFGRPGSSDRKYTYAYIDLKDNFIHPLVYKNLIRLNRKIEELVMGISYFKLDEEGNIIKVENEEEGETGIDFLYKNWSKIHFNSTESSKRDERIDLLKALKKNEVFISKQIVMPAFFRDVNFDTIDSGIIKHDKINDIYSKLLRLVKALEENNVSGIDFISNSTKSNIEKYLVELYDTIIGYTKKKNGIFRQAIMGKPQDYSARNVISCASYSTNSYKEMKSTMEKTGVPLATLLSIFNPFIIKWVQNYFEENINNMKHVSARSIKNLDKNISDKVLSIADDAIEDFSMDNIKDKIKLFIKAPNERFEVVKIKMEDGTYKSLSMKGYDKDPTNPNSNESTIINRELTWTDIFYQAAVDVCKDKYIYITRYPLEDYFGIYPSGVTVLSTFKTHPQYINDTYYEYYPDIDTNMNKEDIRGIFIDSLQVFNAYLNGLDGDFDGK